MKRGFYLKAAIVGVLILAVATVAYPQISVYLTSADEILSEDKDKSGENDLIDIGEEDLGFEEDSEPTVDDEDKTDITEPTVPPTEETETTAPPTGETTTEPTTPPTEETTTEPTTPPTGETTTEPTTPPTDVTTAPPTEETTKPTAPPTEETKPGLIDGADKLPEGEGSIDTNVEERPEGDVIAAIEIDRAAYSAKALQEFKKFYPASAIEASAMEVIMPQLIDRIIDEKFYIEENAEILYSKSMSINGYAIGSVLRGYKAIYDKKYQGVDESLAFNAVTGGVSSDVTPGTYTPYTSTGGSGDVAAGYINNLFKEVRPVKTTISGKEVDKFREFELTVGMDIEGTPSASQVSNADIVILLDMSSSMAGNFDNAKIAAQKFVDTMLPSNYNTSDANSVKIGVIGFGNRSYTLASLTNNRAQLINSIRNVNILGGEDKGINGTNIQSAIFSAKSLLGMDDNSSVDGSRKKIIVVFSDGVATTRSTDIWRFTANVFDYSRIAVNPGSTPSTGTKRWSYLEPFGWSDNDVAGEALMLPDGSKRLATANQAAPETNYVTQKEFTDKVTELESQFLVSQGVEVYTIGYNSDNSSVSFLQSMTKKMNGTPSLAVSSPDLTGLRQNPLSGGLSLSAGPGNYYSASSVNTFLKEISTKLTVSIESKFTPFVLEDILSENFTAVTTPKVSKKPFGVEPIRWGSVSLTNGKLTLTAPKTFEKGTYYATYRFKVKTLALFPFGAGADIYGPNAEPAAPISSSSKIEFTEVLGNKLSVNLPDTKVNVQPNLNVAFASDTEFALVGESVQIIPKIVSSTGYYSVQVRQDRSPIGTKVFQNETNVSAERPYDISLNPIEQEFTKIGTYEYTLYVNDLISGQKVTVKLPFVVREGILNINVLDSGNGVGLPGAFETKLTANIDGVSQDFYLSGLGKRKLTYQTGSKVVVRGAEFNASAYVPFGYEIASISDSDGNAGDGKVKIDLYKSPSGSPVGNEQTINIVVRKASNPKFFFDWSWVVNNIKGSILR